MNDSSPVDFRHLSTPVDVIGDIHACIDELQDLLRALGYQEDARVGWKSCQGRTLVFVGDFVDRGPSNTGVLQLAMRMVDGGVALAVPGNHDVQLEQYLAGDDVPLVYGLKETVEEVERQSSAFQADVLRFLQSLPSHVVLDEGRLVVAHTGLAQQFHGDASPINRRRAAFGVTEGEMDPSDHEKRHAWVADYDGSAAVVYGHTTVETPTWRNNTIDIDTGCVFGWKLTALRWPERTLVSVPARRKYHQSHRKFYPGA